MFCTFPSIEFTSVESDIKLEKTCGLNENWNKFLFNFLYNFMSLVLKKTEERIISANSIEHRITNLHKNYANITQNNWVFSNNETKKTLAFTTYLQRMQLKLLYSTFFLIAINCRGCNQIIQFAFYCMHWKENYVHITNGGMVYANIVLRWSEQQIGIMNLC